MIIDQFNFSDKVCLVTGGTGKLGSCICKNFLELGANLIIVDHPKSNFTQLKTEISKSYLDNIEFFKCNFEKSLSRKKLIGKINAEIPKIDILINNAAFVGTSKLKGWAEKFERQSIFTWDRCINVNLTSVFELTQGFLRLLKSSDFPSIINISSIYGEFGPDWSLYEGTAMSNPAAYAASKSGLIQLTRWLSTTLGPEIRVNSISPGGILRNQPKQFIDKYNQKVPLRRMATEQDIVGCIAFLASELSQYITGQNIRVDGGFSVY